METALLTRRRARAGFTLLEVMIAMVILGIVLISFQATAADRLLKDLGTVDRRGVAMQLAVERLRTVQMEPVYGSLATKYAGTETGMANFSGYTRATTVTRTVSGRVDYSTVTVTVQHAQLTRPVKRTVVVAAP
jgi:prepilin-type N-terminal cleavage/methylation domain-containing protein